jgi:hypothetical protein
VDQNVAKNIQLPAQEGSKLTVMVANGDTILVQGAVRQSPSTYKLGYTFQTTLNFLTLGGCDMVLGVDWISTLGPIL